MPCSFSVTSAGTTSAPSASPERTFSIAASRVFTRIGWTFSNSLSAYWEASTLRPPSAISESSGATRLAKATVGLLGPEESATPATSETTTE